jgi:thiol-disulfide isomerase/thioredoxin
MADMPIRRFAPLLALLVLALVACSSGGTQDGAGGPLLPEDPYELPAVDPASFEALLAELEGTPVLVNVWASWCEPCREEAPHLAAAHAEFGDRVQFLGLDILDEREAARRFMREYGWTYPSVFDLPGAVRDSLGLLGQPVTLFYDASGALADTWVGALTEDQLTQRLERISS